MSDRRPGVAITGIGAVSALGTGAPALIDGVLAGRDGLREMQRIEASALPRTRLSGEVRGLGPDAIGWAVRAAQEALTDSGFTGSRARLAIVSGTTDGERGSIGSIALALKEALGAGGPAITISTACSSSTNALGLGRDLLVRGEADVVLAGGAERLLPEMFSGFFALGVLASDKCAPFGETVGTTLGEGAGYLVLERWGERSGARPRASLLGYALSSDAFHETSPEPRGDGVARVVSACLTDARLGAEDLGYVNAHGTGTAANDDAEWRGLKKALGAHAERVPVSSTKGALGHAQGACGVLELIATLGGLERGTLPPSLRVGRGRRDGPAPVRVGEPTSARIALATNAAFGGANAAVAIGLDAPSPPPQLDRPVYILGAAVRARAPRADREPIRSDHDLRSTDPAARSLLEATEAALADAGLKIRGPLRERTGLFVAANRVSPESVAELRGSIERLGPERASASAFARTVLNAPAGAVSRFLALRGPQTTLVAEGVAGLLALAEAANALMARRDADTILAGAWDERLDESEAEGAACVVLSSTDGPGAVEVRAVVVGGDDEAATEARALSIAGIAIDERRHCQGDALAHGSLAELSAAVHFVRTERRSVLCTGKGPAASVALVLSPRPAS